MNKRSEAARLRAQGLTLQEIARRLGISRQGVYHLLRAEPPLRCSQCGREMGLRRHTRGRQNRPVLCPNCLPADAPFGQRLKAYRLAAGMTQRELAEKAGISDYSVCRYELGNELPHFGNLRKLTRVLGTGLVDLG